VAVLIAAAGWLFFQLAWALLANGGHYGALVQWDAAWYRDVAALGYQGPNVAFFPAFPLLTRALLFAARLSPGHAVLAASQLSALGFWAYFTALQQRLRPLAPTYRYWVSLSFALMPGAFHLVSGYSEPLFLMALAGLVYWTREFFLRRTPALAGLVVLHAGVLSATRIVGVPLVAYPFALALLSRRDWRVPLALSVAGLWGFAAYMLYCRFHFGAWDIYWAANRAHWGVGFDPSPWFTWSFYSRVLPQGNLVELTGRVLTLLTTVWLVSLAREFRRAGRTEGAALTGAALVLLAVTVLAKSGMSSMLRYLLPVHFLLFLAVQETGRWDTILSRRAWLLGGVFAGIFQTVLIIRYCGGGWVS
jgi:hypothetical protein